MLAFLATECVHAMQCRIIINKNLNSVELYTSVGKQERGHFFPYTIDHNIDYIYVVYIIIIYAYTHTH